MTTESETLEATAAALYAEMQNYGIRGGIEWKPPPWEKVSPKLKPMYRKLALAVIQALRASRPPAALLREAAEDACREGALMLAGKPCALYPALDALRAALAVPALSREAVERGSTTLSGAIDEYLSEPANRSARLDNDSICPVCDGGPGNYGTCGCPPAERPPEWHGCYGEIDGTENKPAPLSREEVRSMLLELWRAGWREYPVCSREERDALIAAILDAVCGPEASHG